MSHLKNSFPRKLKSTPALSLFSEGPPPPTYFFLFPQMGSGTWIIRLNALSCFVFISTSKAFPKLGTKYLS